MPWDFIFYSNFSNILTDIQQWGTRAVITYLTMQHHTIHPKLDRSIQVVVRLRIDIHRAAVLIGHENETLNIGVIMIEERRRHRAHHSKAQLLIRI